MCRRPFRWVVILFIIIIGLLIKYVIPSAQTETGNLEGINNSQAEVEIEQARNNQESMWLLFYSMTGLPDQKMLSMIEELQPDYKGKVRFITINVDNSDNQQLVKEFEIKFVPTSIILDEKRDTTYCQAGLIPLEKLKAELDNVVQK